MCKWLIPRAFWRPPDPDGDETCRRESELVKKVWHDQTSEGEFVLAHALRVYAEARGSAAVLDQKALELLKVSGTSAAILIAAVGAFGIGPAWSAVPSLVCFLLAMVLATICRRPVTHYAQTSIRHVLEGTREKEQRNRKEAFLAASLHCTVEQMRVLQNWKAALIRRASWSLCGGVACFLLLPFVWTG